ncbi:hypothetical protein R1sor_019121 [Riccia sorocarpa]|uniref:Uncharacterized protein n=1 Tax=Riccia sorocarpa TaxID=122646 RepID=A0ABD3IEX8_9MARC
MMQIEQRVRSYNEVVANDGILPTAELLSWNKSDHAGRTQGSSLELKSGDQRTVLTVGRQPAWSQVASPSRVGQQNGNSQGSSKNEIRQALHESTGEYSPARKSQDAPVVRQSPLGQQYRASKAVSPRQSKPTEAAKTGSVGPEGEPAVQRASNSKQPGAHSLEAEEPATQFEVGATLERCRGGVFMQSVNVVDIWLHDLMIQHLLDPMHIETNVTKSLIKRIFGEKDGKPARRA